MEKQLKQHWNRMEQEAGKLINEMTGRIKNSLSGFFRVCVVGLLVLFQIILLIMLPFALQQYTVYFYLVLEIGSLIVVFTLVNDSRSPAYKIAWISICLVLPISGQIMFLLWGKTNSSKKIDEKLIKIMAHGTEYIKHDKKLTEEYQKIHPFRSRMSNFLESEGFPLTKNNQIEYYSMGEDAFEAILQDLEKAEHFILIHFFIVAEGAIWDAIHDVCLRKIKEGVEVKFAYDDFGATLRTEKHFAKKLRAEGFQVAIFNPIHRYTGKLYMNYRSHQKIVVIDGNIGYTGGFNIADEYANLIQRFGVWKDTGVRIVGDAVWGLTITFLQMWEMSREQICEDFNKYRPTAKFPESDVYCHIISDGPLNNPNNPIEMLYNQMIDYAREYLYVMTPYLVIEKDMQDALILAVKSGVDVRIITPYIPDKKSIKLVTNYNYGYLLQNGVRIFEYLPGFIHAKSIINEEFGIVGTINMDYRSFYLHYENGVWISNKEVISVIKEDYMKTFAQCKEISYEEWCKRPWKMKVTQVVLNAFSTLL